MKTGRKLILIACLWASQQFNSSADIVGYVNTTFRVGDNLFGNPLENAPNTLSLLIPTAPTGATVSLWNPVANIYSPVSTFSAGIWSVNFTLAPGTGAKLHTSSIFTNTFVGTVLAPDGTHYSGAPYPPALPPLFAGTDGIYLLSSKFPSVLSSVSSPALPVFEYILGRAPHEGEQYTTLDSLTQTYHTTTFISGAWDHGAPVLGVGEAAFFNVGPVPEPSAAALTVLGMFLTWRASRRR